MLLRPARMEDYPAITTILNASWPDSTTTVEQLYAEDEVVRRSSLLTLQRYLVEDQEEIIAVGSYDQSPRFYERGKFRLMLAVLPTCQKRGAGSLLYHHLLTDLQELEAKQAWIKLREDMLPGIHFAHQAGFFEELRVWDLCLDLSTFDARPYEEISTDLQTQGIEVKTLQELKDTPECYRKVYDLLLEIGQDLPSTEHWHAPDYDSFLQDLLKRPALAYFIAVHQDQYVGLSYLTEHEAERYCGIGLTGVRRRYRRKKIALAMKLQAIGFAQQRAYTTIKTSVDSSNRASLAMNERLGFAKHFSWIVLTNDHLFQAIS